jgi:LysR family glycine cleavage system transcriptional activator
MLQRPPPPLTYIRSFECAARFLSFTEAAKELGYTQAAVSMHVRSLEKYVGRPLFLRYPRSLKLTETGEAYLPTLRQALRQIDMATETIVSSARNQTVVIACPMSLAENWIVRCLSGFSKQHPDIEVVIHGTVWDAEIDSVADLTISINRYDEIPVNATRLWEEHVSLLCSPDLAKKIREPADIRDLQKIYVLGRQDYWSAVSKALDIGTIEHDRGFRTNATNIALEMAANGMGLTASLVSLSHTYVERKLLVEPFSIRPPSAWSYYIRAPQCSKHGADAKVLRWIIDYGSQNNT